MYTPGRKKIWADSETAEADLDEEIARMAREGHGISDLNMADPSVRERELGELLGDRRREKHFGRYP